MPIEIVSGLGGGDVGGIKGVQLCIVRLQLKQHLKYDILLATDIFAEFFQRFLY